MKALIRLKQTTHPISEEVIGFRLQAAIPNMAGKAFGKEVPMFRSPYLISESSDHSVEELSRDGAFEKVIASFQEQLRFQGFSEIQWHKAAS